MSGRGFITAAALALPFAAIGSAVAYDQQEHNLTYRADTTFDGFPVVVEIERGKLGLAHGEKIVGYFGGGEPSAIGFGCAGASAPLIAVAAKYLPRCAHVAPIEEMAK